MNNFAKSKSDLNKSGVPSSMRNNHYFLGDPGTLFRSDTIASTFMEQYMRMTCNEFVHKALQNIINKIMDSKLSCEVCLWLRGCVGCVVGFG